MSRFAACTLSLLVVACPAARVFKPAEGVQALDVLEAALHKIVLANPKANPEQAKAARKVVEDVEKAAVMISSNTTTKEVKAKTFQLAIKELGDLQRQWQVDAVDQLNSTAMEDKMAFLRKQLAEKQASLKKVEDELKLDKLKKELAQKQLELEGLTEASAKAKVHDEAEKESAAQQAMLKNMLSAAKDLKDVHKGFKVVPAALKPILADMKLRAHNVSEATQHLDAEEKIREANIDKEPVTGGDAKKKQALLKMINAQSRRAYKKTRAVKVAELAELNDAIKGVETGDVAAVTKVMWKMERETKAFEAKTRGFLH